MPIYEYKCEKCGHEVEKLLRVVEDDDKEGRLVILCSECGGQMIRQMGKIAYWEFKGVMAG